MISIWRSPEARRISSPDSRPVRVVAWLVWGLVGISLLPGCTWMRVQSQLRRDECERLCHQADAARDSGNLARADEFLDRALKKSPRDREVRRRLAESLWNVGRQRESLDILTQLALDFPRDVGLATRLAERLEELGRFEEALDRLQVALATDPSAVAPLELKARIEMAQGRHDEALATYQRLAQLESSQVNALLQMGAIHLRRGQPDRAAPLFRSILFHPRATKEQLAQAHWQLGIAYAQSERWTDAATQLALAIPQRRMSADDWHNVAYAQYRSGDLAAAQDSLNHALGLEPEHNLALKLAGIITQTAPFSEPLLPTVYERPPAREDLFHH